MKAQDLHPLTGLLLLTAVLSVGRAAEPATEPSRPLLAELDRETQSLYRSAQSGIVRLQLPAPRWIKEVAQRDNPLEKWKDLDPAVRGKIEEQQRNAQAGQAVNMGTVVRSSTQPAAGEKPGAWVASQDPATGELLLRSPGGDGPGLAIVVSGGGERNAGGQVQVGGALRMTFQPVSNFTPNNIGLLLDDAGHVLVPLYIERSDVGEGVKAMVGENQVTSATFVGSDRQSNVTVLQLKQLMGRPVKMGAGRPAEGSMVMLLAPGSATGRLVLWTAGVQDWGVAVTMDGSVAGFARSNQFLSANNIKPVADQLIATGLVRRAVLGVSVSQVLPDDPWRQQVAALAGRPALLVHQVVKGSAAEKGGLQAGDFILALGDEPVGDPPTFAAALSARSGKTDLRILRGEVETTISVDLQPQ